MFEICCPDDDDIDPPKAKTHTKNSSVHLVKEKIFRRIASVSLDDIESNLTELYSYYPTTMGRSNRNPDVLLSLNDQSIEVWSRKGLKVP